LIFRRTYSVVSVKNRVLPDVAGSFLDPLGQLALHDFVPQF
jgi:hypothetical protein